MLRVFFVPGVRWMRAARNKIRAVIKVVFLILVLYMVGASGAAGWVLYKYSAVQPQDVEPTSYNTDTIGAQEYDCEDRVLSPNLKHMASRKIPDIITEDENVVILLGDSMIWGLGLAQNETLSYFLNQRDPKRKYINLSLPGANAIDSVERFYRKVGEGKRPAMIVFQLLLQNDIAAGQHLEGKVGAAVERDYNYIRFPYSAFVSKEQMHARPLGGAV